jgi:hypothetical protein
MENNKDILKEHLDLQNKRDKALEQPMNSLTKDYIKSLGKSELEKKLSEHYKGFTLTQFLNHTGKEINSGKE